MNIINNLGSQGTAPQQSTHGTISFQEATVMHSNIAQAQIDLESAARLASRAAVALRAAANLHPDSAAFSEMLDEVTHASGTMLTLSSVCAFTNQPLNAIIQPQPQQKQGGAGVILPDNVQPFPNGKPPTVSGN